MAILGKLGHYSGAGLLIMRIGLGAMMITHGYPKLMGGTDLWTKIGGAMSMVGINAYPTFWGFMAAFAEFFGGLLLVLGLWWRPILVLLVITMLVAATRHFVAGDGFKGYSHALEAGIVFFALIFIGPGRYSLDAKFFPGEIRR